MQILKRQTILTVLFFVAATFPIPLSAASWTQINEDGFGNDVNRSSIVFTNSGNLYSLTNNVNQIEAYRYDNEGDATWSQITSWPFLNDDSNEYISGYIERSNDTKFFAFRNLSTGDEIWRLRDNGNWDQVNEDGFGDTSYMRVLSLMQYNGPLMDDESSILATVTNGTSDKIKVLGHKINSESDEWVTLMDYSDNPDDLYPRIAVGDTFYATTYLGNTSDPYSVYTSDDLQTWTTTLTRERGRISKIVRRPGSDRVFILGDSKQRNCGDYREDLFRTRNGVDYTEVTSRPLRKFCYDAMTFRENGRALLSGRGEPDSGLVAYSMRNNSWNLVTANGFGDNDNEYISGTAVWRGNFVTATANYDSGTEIFIQN